MTDVGPRTVAGRALLDMLPDYSYGAKMLNWQDHVAKYRLHILAIETEAASAVGAAATLDVERLAVALDGLDVTSYDVDPHGIPLDIDVAAARIAAAYNAPATGESRPEDGR